MNFTLPAADKLFDIVTYSPSLAGITPKMAAADCVKLLREYLCQRIFLSDSGLNQIPTIINY